MRKDSFTVIELLVVIAIIGLLSSIVIVAVRGTKEKAEYAKLLQYSTSVKHGLGAYIVGEWKFENNVKDTSGNNNHGTNHGVDFVNNDIGQLKKSGAFNGSGDYVEIPSSSSLNITGDITVEFWMKPATSNSGYLFWKRTLSNSWSWYIYCDSYSDYNLWAAIRLTPLVICKSPDNSIKIDEWQHIVVTYDKSKLKIFINAVESCSANETKDIPTSDSLLIGKPNFDGSYFKGEIDEIRIYYEALSSAEIKEHYVKGAQEKGLTIKK